VRIFWTPVVQTKKCAHRSVNSLYKNSPRFTVASLPAARPKGFGPPHLRAVSAYLFIIQRGLSLRSRPPANLSCFCSLPHGQKGTAAAEKPLTGRQRKDISPGAFITYIESLPQNPAPISINGSVYRAESHLKCLTQNHHAYVKRLEQLCGDIGYLDFTLSLKRWPSHLFQRALSEPQNSSVGSCEGSAQRGRREGARAKL